MPLSCLCLSVHTLRQVHSDNLVVFQRRKVRGQKGEGCSVYCVYPHLGLNSAHERKMTFEDVTGSRTCHPFAKPDSQLQPLFFAGLTTLSSMRADFCLASMSTYSGVSRTF